MQNKYGEKWERFFNVWKSDEVFWEMLLLAEYNDVLYAPTTASLTPGTFVHAGETFAFQGQYELYDYQGYGPYTLTDAQGAYRLYFNTDIVAHPIDCDSLRSEHWEQPLYRYNEEVPVYSGYNRRVTYEYQDLGMDLFAGSGLPWLITSAVPKIAQTQLKKYLGAVVCPECFTVVTIISFLGYANHAVQLQYGTRVDLVDKRTFWCPSDGCGTIPDESYGLWK